MRKKSIVFLMLAFALTSCKQSQTESLKSTFRSVKWTEVLPSSSNNQEYVLPAKVEAAQDVNLSFRVAGVIEKYSGKNGAYVKKGDTLVYMDNRDYLLQYSATKAEYDAISGEANRVIALYKDGSVSENDYSKAVSGLKQITAKLNSHANALSDTRLVAPFDGYIQKLHYSDGETVGAGMPVVSFVLSSSQEVVVNIPYNTYINQDNFVGATAIVPQYPNSKIDLTFIGVSPKANLNQLYSMRFAIKPNSDVIVTPGMSMMVTLNYEGEQNQLLTLPLTALYQKDNKTYVWSINSDNSVKLNPIKVHNINSKGELIISEGVNAGDRVVTAGINNLTEGMKVEPFKQKSVTNIGGLL